MKKVILLSLLTGFVLTSVSAQKEKEMILRHVVMFKFKKEVNEIDIKSVEEAFMGLSKKISFIKDFEWGINNSPEMLNEGLTHCFFLSFTSEKDRDEYLVHPDHKAFGVLLKPFLDKVVVFDYWVKNE